MKYVAVFLGEFGYELFNWQGALRKFAQTLKEEDQLICCSRASLAPFYEFADRYLDISKISLYKKSVACMYWARSPKNRLSASWDRKIKKAILKFVLKKESKFPFFQKRSGYHFIFSSEEQILNGVHFGLNINVSEERLRHLFIYSKDILQNNSFKKISPVLSTRTSIERSLGFSLDEPYILCQTANRKIIVRSKESIPKDNFIASLARDIKVVLLQFNTGRYLDSHSHFSKVDGCFYYPCSSFAEQSCLIHFAKKVLFFTEGDFRSHIYIPPFLGKDVFAVASQKVYALDTTPIDFWNHSIFQFGGQIYPFVSEEIFCDADSEKRFKNHLLR